MIDIEYCKSGESVSDFEVEEWFSQILEDIQMVQDISIYRSVSTTLPIDRVRAAILEGELDYKNVRFVFKDKIIKSNEYGALSEWPDGFCDVGLKLIEKILTGREKHKSKNNKEG